MHHQWTSSRQSTKILDRRVVLQAHRQVTHRVAKLACVVVCGPGVVSQWGLTVIGVCEVKRGRLACRASYAL